MLVLEARDICGGATGRNGEVLNKTIETHSDIKQMLQEDN